MRRAAELSGFTIGVTSGPGGGEQVALLTRLGAAVVAAPVHGAVPRGDGAWPLPEDTGPALRLVDLVCKGAVDAVTFTAGPAVRNFMVLADRARRGRNVLAALNRGTVVVCAGPDCAAAAREEGIDHPLHPAGRQLGPLVQLLREVLLELRRSYRLGSSELVLQGSVVVVDGRSLQLEDCERAVLVKLAEKPGSTVSRRVLLRHVWKDPSVDPAVLDATVARLRAELGPAGSGLETAARRGYRLRAAAVAPQEPRSTSRVAGRAST
jgi:uroporphyrinogen-III synthase